MVAAQLASPFGSMLDDRYRLEELIGTGGMGRVYRATHTLIGRTVAVKILLPELGRTRDNAEQFQREAFASGQLDHPNIVAVSDFGVLSDGTMFLVMELLEGESLAAKIAREGRLAWPDAIEVMRGVLAGMQYAHDRDIVHCDLKPDNLFVARKHGEDCVKVLDFGIARLCATTEADDGDMTIGTPSYLSPEQARGAAITPASDLYSASIVFYELLCGHPPFQDGHPAARLAAHVHRDPPRFDSALGVPDDLEAIVRTGLAKRPSERIASATEYQAQLDAVLVAAGLYSAARPRLISGAIRAASHAEMPEPTPLPGPLPQRPPSASDRIVPPTAILRRSRHVGRWALAATAALAIASTAIYTGAHSQAEPAPVVAAAAPRPLPIVVTRPAPVPVPVAPGDPLLERAEAAIVDGRIAAPPVDNALAMIGDFDRVHPGDPRSAPLRARALDALRASAQLLWAHGKQDSARILYAELLHAAPDDPIARERVATKHAVSAAPSADVAHVRWLVSQVDLAIIERRFVAPAGHNALEYLIQLRKIDPSDEAVRRLGTEVASALTKAAEDAPSQAPALLAAAKQANEPAPAHVAPPASAGSGVGSGDDTHRDDALAAQWLAKGKALVASGDFAGAKTAFERAIGADSSSHAALAGLADVAYNQGEFTRAVLAAKRAVALAPRAVPYRMTLAKSFFKLMRYADAIAQWQKVLEIDPSNASARKNVELARAKLGQ